MRGACWLPSPYTPTSLFIKQILRNFSPVLEYLALLTVKDFLAHANRRGSYLHKLIILDELDGLFQCRLGYRSKGHCIVLSACPHIGQLFGTRRIEQQVAVTIPLSYNLAFIYGIAGDDEPSTAVLQLP